jgi:cytochrome c-type biogenesis protein CcmH/NrfF
MFPHRMGVKRFAQITLIVMALFTFLGIGDDAGRFKDLGHRLACACGCGQALLECSHAGCTYSGPMRGELMAAIDRGDNDNLVLQSFVQKYGTTVTAPTTLLRARLGLLFGAAIGFGIPFLVGYYLGRYVERKKLLSGF